MSTGREKLVSVFKHYGIHWTQITRNALNVSCPMCEDNGTHCGVFHDREEYMFTCWKCKASGSLFDLVNAVTSCSYKDFMEVLNSQYTDVHVASVQDEIARIVKADAPVVQVERKEVTWPPAGSVDLAKFSTDPLVSQFLAKRKLDLVFCITKGCRVGLTERYANRFLLPVYHDKRVVAFQGRDMTGQSPNKYLTCGDVSNYLYGYDEVDETKPIGITEGIFSSWRVDNALCSFSAALGDKQLSLMTRLNPPYWVLVWDMGNDGSDKYWEGTRVARKLAEFFGRDKVKYVTMPAGEDPDSMGTLRMRELMKEPRTLWTNL